MPLYPTIRKEHTSENELKAVRNFIHMFVDMSDRLTSSVDFLLLLRGSRRSGSSFLPQMLSERYSKEVHDRVDCENDLLSSVDSKMLLV